MLMKLLMMAGYQFGMISTPNQLESLTLPKMELTQPSLNMIKLALMAFRQLDLMVPLLSHPCKTHFPSKPLPINSVEFLVFSKSSLNFA